MDVYKRRQLVVLWLLLAAAACPSLLRSMPQRCQTVHPAKRGPSFVYEVRGRVRTPGFHCFAQQPTLGELLQSCGGRLQDVASADMPLASGTRITVGETVGIGTMGAQARLAFFLPIPVNDATPEDLACIPGIGLRTARSIVKMRTHMGGFSRLDDLRRVRGIGKKRLETFKPYLCL